MLAQTIDKLAFMSNNTEELIQALFNEFENNSEIKHIITDLIYLSKCYENLTESELQMAMAETQITVEKLVETRMLPL